VEIYSLYAHLSETSVTAGKTVIENLPGDVQRVRFERSLGVLQSRLQCIANRMRLQGRWN